MKNLEEKSLVAASEETLVQQLGVETKTVTEEVNSTLEIVPWNITNNPVSSNHYLLKEIHILLPQIRSFGMKEWNEKEE